MLQVRHHVTHACCCYSLTVNLQTNTAKRLVSCEVQTPEMYADVPPAPPGLIWWEYLPGVPPLPDPATYFGLSNWTNWGWQYDPEYTVPFYQYTDLDQASDSDPGETDLVSGASMLFMSCSNEWTQEAANQSAQ